MKWAEVKNLRIRGTLNRTNIDSENKQFSRYV
jgi:hypothetical protein